MSSSIEEEVDGKRHIGDGRSLEELTLENAYLHMKVRNPKGKSFEQNITSKAHEKLGNSKSIILPVKSI